MFFSFFNTNGLKVSKVVYPNYSVGGQFRSHGALQCHSYNSILEQKIK